MISLLLDQGLPRSAVAILTSKGYDVLHVADLGLEEAKDMEIIQYARKQERTIVTLDADFHALLKVGGHSGPSVIRLRLVEGEHLYNALGQTTNGRYLSVFFIRKLDNKALIVTAREMDKSERKRYAKK